MYVYNLNGTYIPGVGLYLFYTVEAFTDSAIALSSPKGRSMCLSKLGICQLQISFGWELFCDSMRFSFCQFPLEFNAGNEGYYKIRNQATDDNSVQTVLYAALRSPTDIPSTATRSHPRPT